MGQNPTKAAGNIYCQKRKEAAKFNDRLNSREVMINLLLTLVVTVLAVCCLAYLWCLRWTMKMCLYAGTSD